jgi:hypothetical protein
VEYLWAPWKQHELPNFCPRQLPGTEPARPPGAVSDASPPHTGLSFWEQAERFPLYLYYVIINSSLSSRFCQIEKLAAEL